MLSLLSPKQRDIVIQALVHRNLSITETNPVLIALTGCNSASYFLGSPEQAAGATFYLTGYLYDEGQCCNWKCCVTH